MAAKSVLFADYAKHPKPKRLYVDSSFVSRLLYHELNSTNPVALRPTDIKSFGFYQQLVADGVDIVGSSFTYVEVLHYYCFHYSGGMYELSKSYLAAKGLPSESPQKNFKTFFSRYPADCEAAWKTILYRVGATEFFFESHGIRLLSPLPSPKLTNVTRDVISYASILKDAFVGIEATDAMHLALAHYLDSDAVVSLDRGFLTADTFTVYYT